MVCSAKQNVRVEHVLSYRIAEYESARLEG